MRRNAGVANRLRRSGSGAGRDSRAPKRAQPPVPSGRERHVVIERLDLGVRQRLAAGGDLDRRAGRCWCWVLSRPARMMSGVRAVGRDAVAGTLVVGLWGGF
jgi:hypothetical protein